MGFFVRIFLAFRFGCRLTKLNAIPSKEEKDVSTQKVYGAKVTNWLVSDGRFMTINGVLLGIMQCLNLLARWASSSRATVGWSTGLAVRLVSRLVFRLVSLGR